MNGHPGLLSKDQNGSPVSVDFVAQPDDVLKPEYASKAAAAFWMMNVHPIYERVTQGTIERTGEEILRAVTKPINYGLVYLDRRREGRDEWEARDELGYKFPNADPLALLNKASPQGQIIEVQKELHDLYPDLV